MCNVQKVASKKGIKIKNSEEVGNINFNRKFQSQKLTLPKNMGFMYETHMHTMESSGCGRNTAEEQVYAYKERGYTGIIITDHFINGYSTCPRYGNVSWREKVGYVVAGYLAAKDAGDNVGLDVFLGWEFTVKGSDLLTYGLDIAFLLDNKDIDKLTVPQYSKVVRNNGGFLAQAHPYRDKPYIEHKFPVKPEFIDAIEVYNASDEIYSTNRANEKADMFAKKHNMPIQAGGDSHGVNDPPSGIILAKKAKNIYDIINAIKNKEVSLII
ncbi:MAG: PHP domain-containing protein [Defluviitaleaceae bacterium]|nr:PHP domain-containing protein [Defluviitaleaceae bacterium]